VSHFATCACLSDKNKYPSFFRTVPSDYYQSRALAKLVRHFGWTWVGALCSDNDYGNNGLNDFINAAKEEGICVEYSKAFFRTDPREKILKIVQIIKDSTSKVIVAFVANADLAVLLKEMSLQNVTGYQWIGSESWISDPVNIQWQHLLKGSMGFAMPKAQINGLHEFLTKLNPTSDPTIFKELWETIFECKLPTQENVKIEQMCKGNESLSQVQNLYTDVSELRVANNVYKAVYAVAYALHNTYGCSVVRLRESEQEGLIACANMTNKPWQVVNELKKLNFTTTNGEDVYFDENGDPAARYELLNWQQSKDGKAVFVKVGFYDDSLERHKKLSFNNISITWAHNKLQVLCIVLCFINCLNLFQNVIWIIIANIIKITSTNINVFFSSDSIICIRCPPELWSNDKKTTCVLKLVEFLSFEEIMGIILVSFSLLGVSFTIFIALIFFKHKDTPIVRANNSELSFLLLFSLTLCFLCSLTFIAQPSAWSCMLRHTAFGITFVLCISCVLGKTGVVLMAFRATLPGSNVMKWFGPLQQRLSVLAFTFVQVIICILWLTISPPFPYKNMKYYKEKIILECHVGSALGFWAVSHFSTCACLSNKKKYPSFFRTVPSDYYQSRALAKLVRHFGWTWVGALCSNNDYGNNGLNEFIIAAKEEGICVEYSKAFFKTDPREKILIVVEMIKASTSKVIVAFVSNSDLAVLLKEMALQNMTGFQWIGSESWISDRANAQWQHLLKGSMGFSLPKAKINGLWEFLTKLNPATDPTVFKELWETTFECKLPTQENVKIEQMCKGNESLSQVPVSVCSPSCPPGTRKAVQKGRPICCFD
ncbi:hypothetical protein HF521_003542, partial [Silurus meridionalis]